MKTRQKIGAMTANILGQQKTSAIKLNAAKRIKWIFGCHEDTQMILVIMLIFALIEVVYNDELTRVQLDAEQNRDASVRRLEWRVMWQWLYIFTDLE